MHAPELARWVEEEHKKVAELSATLLERTACVPRSNQAAWIASVREAFEHLRAHLMKHMAFEEDGGYLLPVLERRPGLAHQVEQLQHEHQEIARIMDVIHHMLAEVQPEDRLVIRDCCHRIYDVIQYIEHHKNSENLLVLSVLTTDIGGEKE
jgi:iron-sulfur cluster repair protein YtfE (RIC family)